MKLNKARITALILFGLFVIMLMTISYDRKFLPAEIIVISDGVLFAIGFGFIANIFLMV